jgi:hypothetical protein
MSNESNQRMEDKMNRMNEEIERIFNGQTTITKEKMKQALEESRMGRGGRGRGGRGGMNRSDPAHDEMKRKMSQLLETELNKIGSTTITKEQAKSALLSFGTQAKDQWHMQMDQQMQTSIKDELTKLNAHEISSTQARDLLRNACHKMRPSHGGGPSMLDDNMKNEFLNEFKTKHGSNKISVDEAWEMIKCFDKKQHDKMGCCEKNSDSDKEKDKKWDEMFNEDLAKKIREKLRQEWSQNPGKRVCQH